MLRALFAALALAFLTFSTPAHALPEAEIGPQTLEIGGSTTFTIDNFGGNTNVVFQFAPSVGYWLNERLELLLALNLVVSNFTAFGMGAGVQFNILDPSTWTPYVLVLAGFNAGSSGTATRGVVTPGGGVILAVHPNIGIDLGVRASMSFGDGGFGLSVPMGWLGVRCWFPLSSVTE